MTAATLKLGLLRATVFSALLTGCFSVDARDLGAIGKVYEIREENLIEFMQRKMREAVDGGKVDAVNNRLKSSTERYLERPPGVKLPVAKEYRFHEFDPTWVLDHDVRDGQGNLVYSSGTRVNPLDFIAMNRALCFIDGDDALQVEWGLSHCGDPLKAKLILISGPLGKLMEAHPDRRWYFDQGSFLVRRLGITAVPSVTRQSGNLLVVEEFPVEN